MTLAVVVQLIGDRTWCAEDYTFCGGRPLAHAARLIFLGTVDEPCDARAFQKHCFIGATLPSCPCGGWYAKPVEWRCVVLMGGGLGSPHWVLRYEVAYSADKEKSNVKYS